MATLWREADQFDWFGAYLRDRGLQTQWRIATFVFTVCLAAVPLVMLGSPVGQQGLGVLRLQQSLVLLHVPNRLVCPETRVPQAAFGLHML